MKELTKEQKAKAYDEAIKRARNHHDNDGLTLEQYETIDIIFPELKESEDERIRKWIIGVLSTYEHDRDLRNAAIAWLEKQGKVYSDYENNEMKRGLLWHLKELRDMKKTKGLPIKSKATYNDWIAWLEKQGEFYTKRDVNNAYIEGMAFAKDELEKQGEQILANSAKTCKDEQEPTDEEMKTLLRTEYEKGRADAIAEMQKPAWSEEDESYLNTTIAYLKDAKEFKKSAENCINWLKSLKDRVQPRRRHTIFDEII